MQNALLWTFNVNGVNEFPILSQTQIDAFLVKIATIQMYLFHIWYFVEIFTFYPIIHGKELSYFLLFFLLSNRFISSTSESDKEQRNAMQYDSWIVHIAIIGLLIFFAYIHAHSKNQSIQQF